VKANRTVLSRNAVRAVVRREQYGSDAATRPTLSRASRPGPGRYRPTPADWASWRSLPGCARRGTATRRLVELKRVAQVLGTRDRALWM
jgi:hypothetical protein